MGTKPMIQGYKKLLAFFTLVYYSTTTAFSQGYFFAKPKSEIWLGTGISIFRGDIGGGSSGSGLKALVDYSTIGTALNFGFSQRIPAGFSLRGELSYVMLRGDDAFSESLTRKQRSLHFRTSVVELAAGAQWSLLTPFPRTRRKAPFDAYIHAGSSYFWYQPQAKYNGLYYNLREIGTEGQTLPGGTPYSKFSYSAYAGIGCKYYFKKNQAWGFELSLRRTFTDYIDDVSTTYPDIINNTHWGQPDIAFELTYRGDGPYPVNQVRGNPNLDDSFGLIMITYSKSLGRRPFTSY